MYKKDLALNNLQKPNQAKLNVSPQSFYKGKHFIISNGSFDPKIKTLIGITIPSQSGLGSNGSKNVLYTNQILRNGTSTPNSLVSYPGYCFCWCVCGGGWVLTPLLSI